eukprot:EG_transcript_8648
MRFTGSAPCRKPEKRSKCNVMAGAASDEASDASNGGRPTTPLLRLFHGAVRRVDAGVVYVENGTDWDLPELYIPPALLGQCGLDAATLRPGALLTYMQDPDVPCRIQWCRSATRAEQAAHQPGPAGPAAASSSAALRRPPKPPRDLRGGKEGDPGEVPAPWRCDVLESHGPVAAGLRSDIEAALAHRDVHRQQRHFRQADAILARLRRQGVAHSDVTRTWWLERPPSSGTEPLPDDGLDGEGVDWVVDTQPMQALEAGASPVFQAGRRAAVRPASIVCHHPQVEASHAEGLTPESTEKQWRAAAAERSHALKRRSSSPEELRRSKRPAPAAVAPRSGESVPPPPPPAQNGRRDLPATADPAQPATAVGTGVSCSLQQPEVAVVVNPRSRTGRKRVVVVCRSPISRAVTETFDCDGWKRVVGLRGKYVAHIGHGGRDEFWARLSSCMASSPDTDFDEMSLRGPSPSSPPLQSAYHQFAVAPSDHHNEGGQKKAEIWERQRAQWALLQRRRSSALSRFLETSKSNN